MSYESAACPVEYGHLAHDWRGPSTWNRCPGIKIDPATRARPTVTRRHVLAELRSIKGLIALKITRWFVTGIDYDGNRWVPRRVDEFPENSYAAWDALARTCSDVIMDLSTLRDYAVKQGREVAAYEKAQLAATRAEVRALRGGEHVG